MDKTYEIIDYNEHAKQVVEVAMIRQTTIITKPISEEDAIIIQKALTEKQQRK